jgi:DNA-binding SARP family transcriptional activator
MGAFQLCDCAVPLVLPGSSQHLIAFLALQGRPMTRDAAAGALWPDVSEAQAHASLRSAIWRLDEITRQAMQVDILARIHRAADPIRCWTRKQVLL